MKHVVNIAKLEHILDVVRDNAKLHSTHAISYYPNDVYKTYDAKSVELKKAYAVLSNLTDIRYIELGINGLDKEIEYLDTRASELEQFYITATEDDSEGIELALSEVKKQAWQLKKEKRQLVLAEFEIEVDDFISEILAQSLLI